MYDFSFDFVYRYDRSSVVEIEHCFVRNDVIILCVYDNVLDYDLHCLFWIFQSANALYKLCLVIVLFILEVYCYNTFSVVVRVHKFLFNGTFLVKFIKICSSATRIYTMC